MQIPRPQVITTAMDIIEVEGPQAATMTRIAAELGCGLVPLYSAVPSRAALLDGIAARLQSEAGPAIAAGGGWREELRAQARGLRRAAAAYPRSAITVAGRGAPGTGRPAGQALATLRTAGFAEPDADAILGVVAAFLAGSLLRETGVAPELRDEAALRDDASADADFELGLDLLLRGIVALRRAATRPPRGGPPRAGAPPARRPR